jgi:hypothetical protein
MVREGEREGDSDLGQHLAQRRLERERVRYGERGRERETATWVSILPSADSRESE